jgi:hypothetical protein
LANFLAYCFLNVRFNRQFVPAVAQRHEGAAKDVPVNFSSNLDQTTLPKNFTERGQMT